MALPDEQIATYLAAIEVEGKTLNTQASYANPLRDFRKMGSLLELPDTAAEYAVADVYTFLVELRRRGYSAPYQHRRHRDVKACFVSVGETPAGDDPDSDFVHI